MLNTKPDENKFFIVTHDEITVQYQIPQAMHAALDFAAKNRDEFLTWQKGSNNIVVLCCKTMKDLSKLSSSLQNEGYIVSEFYEPDIGMELTAIAISPCDSIRKKLSNFPLAGKPKKLQKDLQIQSL